MVETPHRFLVLLDADAASQRPDAWLDLKEAATPMNAANAVDAVLATDEAVEFLGLLVDGQELGVATRARLWGSARGFDDAAGLNLPGEPDYELVAWDCPACAARVWRVHTDPRRPPACPNQCGPLRPEAV